MAKCRMITPKAACFSPNNGNDSVPITVWYVTEDQGVIGQFLTLQDDLSNILDPASYLGGGTYRLGNCSVDQTPSPMEWLHLNSNVDGAILTIPVGAQSWSISIIDSNGPDIIVTMQNGAKAVPAQIGTIAGKTETDSSTLDHTITVDSNGNSVYLLYSLKA